MLKNSKLKKLKKLKRARGLEHLHDFHGISPENIAAEIRTRGGIEALASLAAEENPRRPKDQSNGGKGVTSKSSSKSGSSAVEDPDEERTSEDPDDDFGDDSESPRVNDRAANDGDTLLVSISAELRSKLQAIKVGRRVKVIGVRAEKADWISV